MLRPKNRQGEPPPVDLERPFCVLHHLPNPPSVNHLFPNTERQAKDEKTGRPLFDDQGKPVMQRYRAKSKTYKSWLYTCGQYTWVRGKGIPRLAEKGGAKWLFRVEVHINIGRRSDIDNYLKAVLDLLKKERITPDDRYCDDVRIIRNQEDIPEKSFTVQVWRIG